VPSFNIEAVSLGEAANGGLEIFVQYDLRHIFFYESYKTLNENLY